MEPKKCVSRALCILTSGDPGKFFYLTEGTLIPREHRLSIDASKFYSFVYGSHYLPRGLKTLSRYGRDGPQFGATLRPMFRKENEVALAVPNSQRQSSVSRCRLRSRKWALVTSRSSNSLLAAPYSEIGVAGRMS